MRLRTLTMLLALVASVLVGCAAPSREGEPTELRVLVHSSFDAKKDLIRAFEEQHHAKVTLLKAGDANKLVSRALLNIGNPEADVLYGVDNLTFPRVAGKACSRTSRRRGVRRSRRTSARSSATAAP